MSRCVKKSTTGTLVLWKNFLPQIISLTSKCPGKLVKRQLMHEVRFYFLIEFFDLVQVETGLSVHIHSFCQVGFCYVQALFKFQFVYFLTEKFTQVPGKVHHQVKWPFSCVNSEWIKNTHKSLSLFLMQGFVIFEHLIYVLIH